MPYQTEVPPTAVKSGELQLTTRHALDGQSPTLYAVPGLGNPFVKIDTVQANDTNHSITAGSKVSVSCRPRALDLYYNGEIDDSGIETLVQIAEQGIALYQPERTTVHMTSPGGSARALEYWITRTKKWKTEGIEIATQAGVVCASAAAMIVTMGSIGTRFAHPLSNLLYHNPRIITKQGSAFLEQDAERATRLLRDSRTRLNGLIKAHLTDSLGLVGLAKTLKSRAAWMLADGQSLPAIYFAQSTPEAKLPKDWNERFTDWSKTRVTTASEAQHIVKQWNEQVNDLFKNDQFFDLRFIWALLLIDASEDLPALIERDMSTPESEDQQARDISVASTTARSRSRRPSGCDFCNAA